MRYPIRRQPIPDTSVVENFKSEHPREYAQALSVLSMITGKELKDIYHGVSETLKALLPREVAKNMVRQEVVSRFGNSDMLGE